MKNLTKGKKSWRTRKRNNLKSLLKEILVITIISIIFTAVRPSMAQTPLREHYDKLPIAEDKVELSVVDRIRIVSQGFEYQDYLLRLAYCESRFNEFAMQYKNNVVGLDRGVFQINDYFHPEVSDECSMNVECATKWTMEMIKKGRQREWMCDKIVKNNKDYLK
jgi:hypothetical protein